MTRAAIFTQADVARVVRGCLKAGVTPARVEIDPTGRIVAVLATDGRDAGHDGNEWDEVLNGKAERPSPQRQRIQG